MADREQRTHEEEQPPTSMASSAGSADSVESYSDDDDDDDDDDVSDDEEHTSSGVVVAADDAAVDDEPVTVAATHFLRQRSHLASESETEGDGDELAAYAQGLAHPDVVKLHCGYVPWTDKELKDMADKDKVVVDLDIPANRLSGMIYALRFFVMKPGMWGMTSKSKLLVLSPMNLFVLDPASEATLETIAYADITEVTSSDATSLTINVKGQKDTYVCRDMDTKNHFLSAYYQLYYRERADQATTLFQNPTYLMKKRSKSKGSSANPVDIPVLLEVRRASIDRLDLKTKKSVSSILLTNIVKIHKLRSDPHSLIFCEEREAFIGVLVNNLRTIVKEPLLTQEVSDASEYDALVYLSDEPAPVTFEMPVLKLSKASAASQKTVHLALTRTQILERDPVTRRTTFKCEMADIFNVVMYTEELGGGDHFALEFKNGRTRRYIALPGAVSVRSAHIGLGLEKVVEAARLKELQAVVMDPTFRTSTAFKSAGSTTILTATATRNLFLSNLFEMIHKNHKHVSWSTEETPLGCKVGLWSQGDVASEWEDHLLKKLHVSWKATHDTQQWFDELFRVLEQFNKNIPVGGLTPTKSVARPLGALLKVLESLKGYIVLKIKDPSVNSHAAIPSPMLQTALLLAIQRLLHTTSGFTEMLRKDYRKYIGIVMEFLYSPVAEVAFAAAGVVQAMVVNYSGDRTAIKMELANRKNVFFSEKRCALFVQRIFDPQAQHTNMYADALVPNKAMNRVLSLDLLGADYLVLSSMLRTLEACMSSGKKATPDVVFSNLLRAMNIESFGSHYTLFAMNRSLSFAITKYSSTLVKVHVLEQPSELVESIQDFARVQGALLWQLYLSVSGHDQSQRRISSQLLALLTHENPRSSNLIRNVFPFALLGDVPAEKMSFDEFGRHLPSAVSASSSSAVPLSSVPDLAARAAPASSPTDPTASARSLLNYDEKNASEKAHAGVTSRFEVVRATKNVVLYPDFFDKIRTEMTQKDLKWNSACLTELQERLMAEISALDINRLKNYYFVLVNPNERTETPIDRALDGVRREPSLLSAQFPSMFSQLDSTTPLPEAQDEAADEKAADEHGHADHADKDALSRVAMKPVWFLNWNANEFQVDYKVTADEVRVGAYYLEYLLATDLADEIVDPEPFMTLLYFRLVASSSDDRVRLLCLKVMTQLYNKYAPMLPSLVFLNPLLATTMDASAWPLTVRGHVMLFAERVLSNAVNVARFLYEPRNVELVLSLLKEVQPLVDQPEAESIVQTCLLVLLKLVHSQTSRGEELVKTEYFVGDDGAPGAAVGPISAIKQCLAQDRHLKFLVTLLAYPNRSVYRQVLHLLHLLVQNNASMVPSLHATGLFYYLILNARNEEEMVWAATFLEKIHLRQRRVHMTPEAVAALLKESPVADDSLTERCLKSWLVKILPVSLIAQLVRHGAAKFASVFFGTSNDPETMWNDAMRSHMTSQVREFVANHLINGVFVLTSNEDDVATPLITYPEEVYMLQVYQYYLHNLLNEEKFPNWPINDVPAFLRALLESVHAYVYPSSLASKPSFEDLGLIFDAIGLLFRRFWASTLAASIHETINVSTLLMALKKCTETAMPQDVAGWKAFTNLCLVLPTLYKSKEVVALLKDTSVVSGIRVLHGALSTAHEHKDATVTKCLLETFELVLKSPVGRDALAVSSSFNLLPCVTPYLTFDAPTELTLSALLVVQNMALASSASKSDMLVEWLAQNGVLWYLAELICQKHGREAVRREAAEALKRLLRQDAASPSRGRVQRTIELVFTRPLIDLLLCSTDADMFLQVVADDVKKPHMMWTASMRSELLALAAQAHASAREMELPVHFMYEAQKSELRVADIYVNFYNAYPEAGIHALISTGGSMGSEKNSVHVTDQTEIRKRVMANLLSALSHDIAGVRARPEILDAVLNDRMLPVVTAVRHMLQHTPEMDVQLVEVDGIVTLFAGLDHDDTMLRFSSPKAAFFQLRIMECLQIAMFSPKCIERIVEKVPMYVKSLFSLVYTHLPKRKESDEGMLARVTLQVLGNLCLVPTCIDKLVSGMDAAALTHVLPQLTSGNNHNDVELLLNMHTTVLKRHTNLSIAFAKGNSMGPMVTALLNLLAAPDAIAGSTKAPIARFLSVLSIIPGNQVMPVLRDSKLWKDYSSSMDRASMSDSSSDIKKWLVVPAAPALLKFRHANPQKIGVLSS
ncbi:hypothetical protein SPRG_00066 [Saprolegnia parasitica CBS 223.65]|uniref:DnaJ homologue subfamily C GRV2/DNAJC13 N-terminal domain-containing protein n=1 Tax=Saprolegnia parasitica (strain CBS 223.65) TaxID=695850 RepID=A0A067D169_SAPPC|nr:hypothetical protein SPRG_00066 [Saprolegnia parasitica CBS 223.65]KDO35220.1 hypothetical protein SPRG_00066 [Saprolegnia parasitica CBS 223.65]|eukprot:XP_012193572.1 hypothetical protein SPRG_00066 [Saprolegnia parasitica CBS 223.65]